jgi:phosphoribosylformimino-5-aminoimidazole carboxamide ribotide isomerase
MAALQVIPVIDLMGGKVVHARMGDRASYRPIETPLARGSEAVDVISGLLGVYPFGVLYVADLDAIQRSGDNFSVLRGIRAKFPALSMWIDTGAATQDEVDAIVRPGLGSPIIGSESQRDASLVARHRNSGVAVLSLDFRGDVFQGPAEILNEPKRWPRRVIVMTLARVGGGAGPDVARLAAIRSIAEGRELYAAGGVRDAADLAELGAAGAAGALVATALHQGRIVKADLEAR